MLPSSVPALAGLTACLLGGLAASATANDPCSALQPELFGPTQVWVADLPTQGSTTEIRFDVDGLGPLAGIQGVVLVGIPGIALLPVATELFPGEALAHVPSELLDQPQLQVAVVNYIETLDEYCLSEVLNLDVLPGSQSDAVTVGGELRQWHTVQLDLRGPALGEQTTPNPFLDIRADVQFEHVASGRRFDVPGFYAADGDAAETSADSGDV